MKELAIVIVLIVVLGILSLLVFGTRQTTQVVHVPPVNAVTNSESAPAIPSSGAAANPVSTTDLSARAVAVAPATNEIPLLPPLTVLDKARVAIHNYHAAFGENPVGDNAEITAALLGKNPRQINFITAESGLRVNDRGEMVDAYGTPFFFHQLSAKLMEIRSAGEDKKLWTFDDLVTR